MTPPGGVYRPPPVHALLTTRPTPAWPDGRSGGAPRPAVRRRRAACLAVIAGTAIAWAWGPGAAPARAQDRAGQAGSEQAAPPGAVEGAGAETGDENPYEGRPVVEVRLTGLKRVDEQYARNQLRTSTGRPLAWETVRGDVRRLERLGEFRDIQADVFVRDDLSVVVLFTLVEAPIVSDVSVAGNRQIPDEDIRETVSGVTNLLAGIPIDEYQIGRAQRAIEELYQRKGYYQAQVTVDQSEVEETGEIIFRVREGERIKLTDLRLQGNNAFAAREVRTAIRSKTAGLFQTGAIDDATLDADVAAIVKFYLDRGYLDVRASRQITPSPDGREAILTFLIDEGPLYTLRSVEATRARRLDEEEDARPGPTEVFTVEQLKGLMELKPGDVLGRAALDRSMQRVREAYQKLGYVDAQVEWLQLRDPESPRVDLRLTVSEGERFKAGMVTIQGNELTQQKVVRRLVGIRPERWLDATEIGETERRLRDSRLFNTSPQGGVVPTVTIQPEDPDNPGYRDVLVEVEETDTGSISFGAAITSDAGVTGVVNLNQRNFDIGDTPDSWDELIRGRAFRGGGQNFNIALQPGFEQSSYVLGLTEPWLFDTPYSLSSQVYFRQRQFDEYDEDRVGTRWGVGRRFGTRWSGVLSLRAESINLMDVDADSATDILELEGQNTITSLSPELTRSTLDSRFRPTRGTATSLGLEQVGALGGDFSFTKLSFDHQVFFPVYEDVLGLTTVVSVRTRIGYIVQEGEAPIFERLFLGGRSFRGFDFRGIGPEGFTAAGARTGDKVGGEWALFNGIEVEHPIWRELVSVAAFVDSGTLIDRPGFDDYRVAIGAGIRLYVPQLGPAPLAFDFAVPLRKEDGDETQLFTFSIELPLQ